MTTTWILIANGSHARVYSAPKAKLLNGNPNLHLVNEYQHPASREKILDLISDKHGHMPGCAGPSGAMESADPKRDEMERFSRELAECLESGRQKHCYEELIVVAPPQFHGMLNKHMSRNVSEMVQQHIDKDYTHYDEQQVCYQLENYL